MSATLNFKADGTAAQQRPAADKIGERVSVLDYGAIGDGVTDDSVAIQAAIDANKAGTIVLPQGKTFLAAGILFNGAIYNGTSLTIEGTLLMKARASSSTWNWDITGSPTYNAIIGYDVDGLTIDVPGMIDGNRTNQPSVAVSDQQTHCVHLRGVRNFSIPHFNAREIRGDGILITTKTNVSPLSTNSKNGRIGDVKVTNSADDGRNAISVVSCENLSIAGGTSFQVGGTIGGDRMPGGLDIEPDGNWHFTRNIVSGPWSVTTAGTSGIAIDGKARTNDATRDWIVSDVQIANSVVVCTSVGPGGPIFRRCARVSAQTALLRTGARDAGITIDYADFCDFRLRASGVMIGISVGYNDFVNDSKVDVQVTDHSGAGLSVVGANRSVFTGGVGNGQGAGSYGVQAAPGSRGTVTQSAVTYSVDVPYDANNTFGFATSAGVTFSNGSCVANCAFLGYPNFSTMFGFNVNIRTRNVAGRNNAATIPVTGNWASSDIVLNDGTAAGGTPGWVCTTAGAAGTFVFKAMANIAA